MSETSSRDLLIRSASALLRRKGYHGMSVGDVLAASGLPKGSLYHHFPGGKRELSIAATEATGAYVSRALEGCFEGAERFSDGLAQLCRAVAGMIDGRDKVEACPVASILHAAGDEPELRAAAQRVLDSWRGVLAGHAARLGHPAPERAADLSLMRIEGAWLMVLAEQGPAPLLRLARAIEADDDRATGDGSAR